MIHHHDHSLFQRLLLTLIMLVTLISLIFVGAVFSSNALRDLKQSSYNLFDQRVVYRTNELQKLLASTELGSEDIADILESCRLLYQQQNTASDPELNEAILQKLFSITHKKMITGAYIIFDKQVFQSDSYPAFYLYDTSPSEYFSDMSDISAKYGDATILKQNRFILEHDWKPSMQLHADNRQHDFYFNPLKTAHDNPKLSMEECAYWGTSNSMDAERPVITYSMPLIGDDHIVYGVIGFDLTLDYLKTVLPYSDLGNENKKAFVLAHTDDASAYQTILTNGPAYSGYIKNGSALKLEKDTYGYQLSTSALDDQVIGSAHKIHLYDTNTPFEKDSWYLIGITDKDELYSNYQEINRVLFYASISAIIIAGFIALYASMIFTKPIRQLAAHLRQSTKSSEVKLPRTKIKEIDELSNSIEDLSHHLSGAEFRLSYVLHTIDMPIGAIEVFGKKSVFCTEKVGHLLGFEHPDKMEYSFEEFKHEIDRYTLRIISYEHEQFPDKQQSSDMYIVHTIDQDNQESWHRFLLSHVDKNLLIVISDVTAEIHEKENLIYERDHDVLTQLLNRRAFRRECDRLIADPSKLGVAAMVLRDLDNLKLVNDTYGHDAGDRLICMIANLLRDANNEQCITSRMAGDEFLLFYHHYHSTEEILDKVQHLHEKINETEIHFSEQDSIRLKVSAGIAWMPKDADDFDTLVKYADFAMYEVKNYQKGGIRSFSKDNYLHNNLLFDGRQELLNILDEERVQYAFQPIVNAHDGSILGYEALMRPISLILKTPLDIMWVARTQKQLYRVERMTWIQALKQFSERVEKGTKHKIFINSIPSIPLLEDIKQQLEEQFHDFLGNVVIELLESEEIEASYMQTKQEFCKRWNAQTALDDFGSGYSSDHRLLSNQTNYVKIDMEFVRNIALDKERQMLVKNVLEFAHSRGIQVIAEGVESYPDMKYLIQNGIDYLQGYYLGKPEFDLQDISEAVKVQIRKAQV